MLLRFCSRLSLSTNIAVIILFNEDFDGHRHCCIVLQLFKRLLAAVPWGWMSFFVGFIYLFIFYCKWIINSGRYTVREQSVWAVWQGGLFWSLFSCSHNPPTQTPLEGGRALCWRNTAVWSLTVKERQLSAKRRKLEY